MGEGPINWNQRRLNKRAVIEEMINILVASGFAWAKEIFGDMKTLVVCSAKAMMCSDPNESRAKATIVEEFFVERLNS